MEKNNLENTNNKKKMVNGDNSISIDEFKRLIKSILMEDSANDTKKFQRIELLAKYINYGDDHIKEHHALAEILYRERSTPLDYSEDLTSLLLTLKIFPEV